MALSASFRDGGHKIIAKIGRGGMADVYLAFTPGPCDINKLVVIKRLLAEFAEQPTARQMFLEEARVATMLSHPNVIQTFEVSEHADEYFITMEYLAGQSLRHVIRACRRAKRKLTYRETASIVVEILKGLHYVHEVKNFAGQPMGLVHRDVSPPNIFVTYEGLVKVVDFGIAKAVGRSAQTESGIIKGKPAYMAPEQALGEEVDRRADLFCCGIMLWEMLTDERLFAGTTSLVSLIRLIRESVVPPMNRVPDLPDLLNDIAVRSLERDPKDRYPTAKAMRRDLEKFLGSCPEGPMEQEELGALVISLFAEQQAQMNARIHEAISRAADSATQNGEEWIDSRSNQIASWFTASDSGRSFFDSTPQRMQVTAPKEPNEAPIPPAPPPFGHRRRALLLAGGIVVGICASVLVWFAGRTPLSSTEALDSAVPLPSILSASTSTTTPDVPAVRLISVSTHPAGLLLVDAKDRTLVGRAPVQVEFVDGKPPPMLRAKLGEQYSDPVDVQPGEGGVVALDFSAWAKALTAPPLRRARSAPSPKVPNIEVLDDAPPNTLLEAGVPHIRTVD